MEDGLKFKANSFDMIISQVCVPYIGDKAALLQDIWRVLKKDGKAFIHLDNDIDSRYPDFMTRYKDTPRMIIYKKSRSTSKKNRQSNKKNILISTRSYLNQFKKKGFDMNLKVLMRERKSFNLIMKKSKSKPLNLNLKFDGVSTLYLTPMKHTDRFKDRQEGVWWGTRSVFRVQP